MNSKKRRIVPANNLFAQFITYLLSPRKKQLHVEKADRENNTNPHQNKREKLRRIRQGLAGLNC